VLGKHSGRHAFRERLQELGYGDLTEEEINQAFERFKRWADKKKVVTDADIEAIIADEVYQPPEIWHLNHIQVSCGDNSMPTASVSLTDEHGNVYEDAALGFGPVDALYKAINRIVQVPNTLNEFSIKAITEGMDAAGEVTIRIQPADDDQDQTINPQTGEPVVRTFSGRGVSTDIIVASARAYVNALNRLIAGRERRRRRAAEVVAQETL
jgi:2-isopropylmalate synthase